MSRTRTRLFAALATVVLGVGLAVAPGTPAAAATYDARFPWELSSCKTHAGFGVHKDITSSYRYYGWAEWRVGTSGSCLGYQWVRLHITAGMPFVQAPSYEWVNIERPDNGVHFLTEFHNGGLGVGTYDTRMVYSRGVDSCANLGGSGDAAYGVYSPYHFGNYQYETWCD